VTHVELFAGTGGISIAAEWAGFRTVAQVEQDPYCLKVLEKHWPDVHRVSDIRDFPDQDYGAVTLVSGGFPCQPFSAAGKRRGKEDDRYLWPEMRRVIAELKPTWIVAENVAGLISMAQFDSLPELGPSASDQYRIGDVYCRTGSGVLKTILEEIEALGYEVAPIVVPAAGAGAPHYRYRVFIVAKSNGAGGGGEIRNPGNEGRRSCQDGRESIPSETGRNKDIAKRDPRAAGQDVANTPSLRCEQGTGEGNHTGRFPGFDEESGDNSEARPGRQDVANTESVRGSAIQRDEPDGVLSADVSDTDKQHGNSSGSGAGQICGESRKTEIQRSDWWAVEPGMGNLADGFSTWLVEPDIPRVARGVKDRVNKLRALGNAVVPQQIYPILQAIAEVEER